MPNHKSAVKRVRQSKKLRERNRINRSALRTALKRVRNSASREEAMEALPIAFSNLDKAVKRNLIHFNTASRYKSRLSHFAAKLS